MGERPKADGQSIRRSRFGRVIRGGPSTAGGVRHPSDVVRATVGGTALVPLALATRRNPLSRFETDVFRLVNDLPSYMEWPLRVVMQIGSLPAVAVAGVGAVVARRPRLARDLVVAGGVTWFGAKLVKQFTDRGRPGDLLVDVVHRGAVDVGLGFPSGHTAVAAALAGAAGPYLGRTGRRACWAMVLLVAIARIYVGAHLPADVVGGALLGWTTAALVHLAFGTPDPGADPGLVGRMLADVVPGTFELVPLDGDARGSTPYRVVGGDGRLLFVKVLDRLNRDSDTIFKAWRWLTRRSLEDETPFVTHKQQAEHESFLSLLALRAGVSTPGFVTTATSRDASLLAFEWTEGRTLDSVGADVVTDATLDEVWRQVGLLRNERIAHRDLRLANVMIGEDGTPIVVDFGFSEAAATDHRLSQDVAELLASTALVVGADRAVRSAHRVLGPDPIADAVPLMQPIALSSATRSALRSNHGLLESLRSTAASISGEEEPELESLVRVRPRTVLMLVGLMVAVHLLLPQVGELRRTIEVISDVDPLWLAMALACSVATYVAAGVAQVGAVLRPLSLGRTIAVQLAASFTNKLAPANLGGAGINVRYLQKCGVPAPAAVAGVALDTTAGVIVHVTGLVAAFLIVGRSSHTSLHLPSENTILVVVAVVMAVGGIVLWSPLGRRRVVPYIRQGFRSIVEVVKLPGKAAQLFGGSAAVTAFYVLALYTSLGAFHARLGILQVTAVYLGAAAVASVAPTPGGLGAMEAALVAGLTALGEPTAEAIAGVLTFRLVTFWLPVIPAWFVFRRLVHDQVV